MHSNASMAPTRRDFIRSGIAITASFSGLKALAQSPKNTTFGPGNEIPGFGELVKDPKRILDLPEGFNYQVISKTGELMTDGLRVPGAHDGMGTFRGPNGLTILVRNHEVNPDTPQMSAFGDKGEKLTQELAAKLYDNAYGSHTCHGGTTTLVYDTKKQKLLSHHLSLNGTIRNCAGGVTPWDTWVTCEETTTRKNKHFEQSHGYAFEVAASSKPELQKAEPLRAMGRFNREAVAVDEVTGIVYQTEDRGDGLLYRFIPKVPGKLHEGGKVQALGVKEAPSTDTRNWANQGKAFPESTPLDVEWIDLEDIESPKDDLRMRGFKAGAARFARGEGIWSGNGEIYWACTNGGKSQLGQIFKYTPGKFEGTPREREQPGKLELFVESKDSELLGACDNLTGAPWGGLVVSEDNGRKSSIVGITPNGECYRIGQIGFESELTGICFSPDATTMFVNAQWNPGMTLAITGPWERLKLKA